jgi:hypothetical protein
MILIVFSARHQTNLVLQLHFSTQMRIYKRAFYQQSALTDM